MVTVLRNALSDCKKGQLAGQILLGSLSTRDFRTRTANGSELFSLKTYLHITTFTLLSTFSPSGMISMKIWETALSCHAKCSLPVAVRVSKTYVLKLPTNRAVRAHRHIEIEIARATARYEPNNVLTAFKIDQYCKFTNMLHL